MTEGKGGERRGREKNPLSKCLRTCLEFCTSSEGSTPTDCCPWMHFWYIQTVCVGRVRLFAKHTDNIIPQQIHELSTLKHS